MACPTTPEPLRRHGQRAHPLPRGVENGIPHGRSNPYDGALAGAGGGQILAVHWRQAAVRNYPSSRIRSTTSFAKRAIPIALTSSPGSISAASPGYRISTPNGPSHFVPLKAAAASGFARLRSASSRLIS
jgi:hypothetical protein